MTEKGIIKESVSSERRFIKFIAYLQIIGIILVVFGHSLHEYPDGRNGYSLLLSRLLSNFRMPVFVFVSGFLMVYTCFLSGTPRNFGKFAYSKIKRLLIPFFVLSLLTFVPRSVLSVFSDDSVNLSWDSLKTCLFVSDQLVIPFFWFIQASFVLLVSGYGWLCFAHKKGIDDRIAYGVLLLAGLWLQIYAWSCPKIWAMDKVCLFAVFFALGCIYARYMKVIDRIVPWSNIWFFICCVLIWRIGFPYVEKTVWQTLTSFFGVLMMISFTKWIENRNYTFLDHLIGANYMIFLLSWYFNTATQQVLAHFTDFPWWVYTSLSLVCGIYIPCIIYKQMEKNPNSRYVKLTAFLLGQSFSRRDVGTGAGMKRDGEERMAKAL